MLPQSQQGGLRSGSCGQLGEGYQRQSVREAIHKPCRPAAWQIEAISAELRRSGRETSEQSSVAPHAFQGGTYSLQGRHQDQGSSWQ